MHWTYCERYPWKTRPQCCRVQSTIDQLLWRTSDRNPNAACLNVRTIHWCLRIYRLHWKIPRHIPRRSGQQTREFQRWPQSWCCRLHPHRRLTQVSMLRNARSVLRQRIRNHDRSQRFRCNSHNQTSMLTHRQRQTGSWSTRSQQTVHQILQQIQGNHCTLRVYLWWRWVWTQVCHDVWKCIGWSESRRWLELIVQSWRFATLLIQGWKDGDCQSYARIETWTWVIWTCSTVGDL